MPHHCRKEKDKELRKARTEIEEHNCLKFVTKKQLEELEKENSRLKKDIPVRETEIQKLKKELKVTEQAKVKERDSENNRQQAGNTIKENTEEIARLKNDLLEIKRYCKDVFEKLDQKDKMISQLQEKLNIPTGERNPTPTTRYGAVSKTDTLQFLSR
ncbi:uncharacterized protein LOC128552919 [Mercenaria mercenaria]|uniref:uncharacterized protein LOC128552919 n=1 Tax=Mercenaria mercenaria TaxID=6596 RepID=UPI00234EEFFF|nr:uncharacterized protein LOC128552919 [Mercenaria mercenaria]